MKKNWKVKRVAKEQDDGQKRWDQAFNQLLEWTDNKNTPEKPLNNIAKQEEAKDENSDLRKSIDDQTNPSTDH